MFLEIKILTLSTIQVIGSPKICPTEMMMQERNKMKAVTLQWSLNTTLSIQTVENLR